MSSIKGLVRNALALTSNPLDWRVSREAIMQRGAMQHVDELAAFAKLVRRQRPKMVIEIGTAQGGVFWLLCQLTSPGASLISLDLPPKDRFSGGKTRPIDLKSFKQTDQTVYAVHGNSHSSEVFDKVQAILAGRQVDLLFIDGDHTYDGVRSDYLMYQPLVRSGGLIAFHDIVKTPWEACEVDRFWAELKAEGTLSPRSIVSPFRSHFGGIGLLTQQ
jgi:cephalosporin hydroxylase